ncbi:MAG: stage II sporulation protein P, partial [Lachnospiraceae bacterium]|nr:stage II sporulation protein P [Lachnospiraceae bacterium]
MDELIPAKNSENNRCIVSGYMDENCQIESYNIDETVDVGSVDVDLQTATDSDSEYQSMVQGGNENTSIQDNAQGESDIPVINLPANNLDIGINYSMEQLTDFEFLINNCYTIDSSTSITPEDVDVNSLLAMDMSVDLSGDDYKVLIYHSHGSEAFADSRPGVTEDSIIGVGDELTRILEEDYGIKTYHDRTVYDVIDGKLDRNYAYTNSGYGIDKILEEHPSIQVVLDIHRDALGTGTEIYRPIVNIGGVDVAQILLVVGSNQGGLSHSNWRENLKFALKIQQIANQKYPGLCRYVILRK